MSLYIDPGTGSMLFTIIIGVLGVLVYAFRNVLMKLRFVVTGGKKVKNTGQGYPFVFFTDSKRYWTIFKPICDEMEKRGEDVLYLTASEDDPLLNEKYEHIKAEYLGPGNKAFARMNMLKADIVMSSTPSLEVYQWKRSRDVKWYVHVLHAANDVALYHIFGVDYYDALLLNGKFQEEAVRKLETLRNLPAKEIRMVGLPHMDALWKRYREAAPIGEHETTVLLAPSWGPDSILVKYGNRIIDRLLETGYRLIIRPHPQSFTSEKETLEKLMKDYPDNGQLHWDMSVDNFESQYKSDILISDFSGIIFDYAMVFDKPVIIADVSFDNGNTDAWWLKEKEWTFTILEKLGLQLTEDNLENIRDLIDQCLHDNRFKEGRDRAREEAWCNIGNSVVSIADYLVNKRKEILKKEQEEIGTVENDSQTDRKAGAAYA